MPSLTDVRNTSNTGTPELHIVLDRMRMAQLNVTSQQVATALRTALSGSLATVLRPAGQTQQDITLIAADAQRYDLVNLSAIPVGARRRRRRGAAATTRPRRRRHARPDRHDHLGTGPFASSASIATAP